MFAQEAVLWRSKTVLPRHVLLHRCNYLHRGDALERLHLASIRSGAKSTRSDLIASFGGATHQNRYLAEVIRGYGNLRSRTLGLEAFRTALEESSYLRSQFRRLGCRGFSFALLSGFSFLTPLRKTINLKVAIVPENDLFYPRRIRTYLRNKRLRHFSHNGLPPIAFLLGAVTGSAWFVFILQSDLATATPSYIRDHFRGWRRVLFACLIRLAIGRARSIFLPIASDVAATCSEPAETKPVSDTWTAIYDETAEFFQMQQVRLPIPTDIETLSNCAPYLTGRFHHFKVPDRVDTRFGDLFGFQCNR